ncbi:MAG TPA: DegT/DnrJ/EryC1/StrS family aminotransferase [Lacunisphaera sp.]|nr:DegT/DnrJ/EryC1/StrS family aminotransferase [Lacunisphaera sp.]
MSSAKVPFLDLKAHHDPIRQEVMAAINAVIDENAFAGGKFVTKFEEEYAKFCETKFSVGVGNGTDAIWFALLALGVGKGDEVITVPMTFMATTEAISYAGATPVFVDIDDRTYTMNVSQIEAAITPRTKAIIPVHLFGQCADMDPILAIAKKHKLAVVEDGAQSQGTLYKGRKSGSMGDAGATSYYPGKNLGAWGEAGGITTNDPELRQRMVMFREHGQKQKYFHDVIGWNGRMDGIQAAVLSVKLKYLEQANNGRRRAAARYNQLLAGLPGLVLPTEADYSRHIYHIYAVRVGQRDKLMQLLGERGIGTGIHYPVCVHLQKAYAHLGLKRGDFPVSEACADSFLSLPMFPEITDQQIDAVVAAMKVCLPQVSGAST